MAKDDIIETEGKVVEVLPTESSKLNLKINTL